MLSAWISIIILFTALSWTINIEILFIIWLIGLLVAAELTDPIYFQPGYMKNISIIIAIAVLIFGIIVVLKTLEIMA